MTETLPPLDYVMVVSLLSVKMPLCSTISLSSPVINGFIDVMCGRSASAPLACAVPARRLCGTPSWVIDESVMLVLQGREEADPRFLNKSG
jgi:hypothetical protein